MNALGIDGGGSSSKWVVLDEQGQMVAWGRAGPITGHIFAEETRNQLLATLDELLDQVRSYKPVAVVAGITGLDAGTQEAGEITQYLRRGLNTERVAVMNDMDLAYRANFSPGQGILVYAGTGSVAYHITQEGRVVRAGGHGYLIGDEGGGFVIGRSALRQLMRWHDMRLDTGQFPLATRLYSTIGGSDWPGLREYVYSGGRQAVAALAPAVGEAAAMGDPVATQILRQAGLDLGDLAQTLQRRLGQLPVVLTGGALKISPLIEQSASEVVPMKISQASSAGAAAKMALRSIHAG